MIKKLANILLVVVLIVAALAIKDRFFPSTVVKTKTVTVRDTVYHDTTIYRQLPAPDPDTIVKTKTQHDTIRLLDSIDLVNRYLELYDNYYAKRYYSDTFQVDTSTRFVIQDTVTKNQIIYRDWQYNTRQATSINNITNINQQTSRFLIGAEAGFRSVTPALIFQKQDIYYKAGYSLGGPNPGVRIGIYTSLSNIKKAIW
jgi:hypothetical protein